MRLGSLILLLALCMSLFSGCSKDAAPAPEKEALFTALYEDVLYVADSRGRIHTTDFYGEIYIDQTSMDGGEYIAVDNDDYTLVYFDGTELKTLASKVSTAVMSADGKSVAYITVTDEENNISELRLYAKGKERLIDRGYIVMCSISPDGSAVGYTTTDEERIYRSYYWDGSAQIHEVGKHRILLHLSNGGEYIYFVQIDEEKRTEEYFVQCGDDRTSKMKLPDIDSSELYFNRDATELMYTIDRKTYFVIKGSELIEISADRCGPMLPEGALEGRSKHMGPNYITYDMASFGNCFYRVKNYDAENLIYMNGEFDEKKVADNFIASTCYVTRNGKTLFYSVYDGNKTDNYVVDATSEDLKSTKLFEGNRATVINDGKCIYYISPDQILCKMDGTKPDAKPEKLLNISDDAVKKILIGNRILSTAGWNSEQWYIETSKDGKTFFFVNADGELMAQTGTKKPTLIAPREAKVISSSNGKLFYYLDDQYFCYEDGKVTKLKGLEDLIAEKGMLYIYEYGNVLYTGKGNRSDFAGGYFSVDGENFMPIVKNYNYDSD